MIAGIIWKVEALPTPVAKNRNMKQAKKPRRRRAGPSCRGSRARRRASHHHDEHQKVTRAPPNRSAIQPVNERDSAPTSGPRKAILQHVDIRELSLGQQRERRRKADERAERAGVEPAHDPVVLALEDHRLICEEALHVAMSFMPNQAAKARDDDERHPDEARILQPELGRAVRPRSAASPPSAPKTPTVMTSGTTNCIDD